MQAMDLLIAPPQMPDPRFRNRVLLLTDHGARGSQAIVINHPTDILGSYRSGIDSHTVFWGGPVRPDLVYLLHSTDWSHSTTRFLTADIAVTPVDRLDDVDPDAEQPGHWRCFSGLSVWAPGQLAAEVQGSAPWDPAGSWLITPCPTLEWLLECPVDRLWPAAMTQCAQHAVNEWL